MKTLGWLAGTAACVVTVLYGCSGIRFGSLPKPAEPEASPGLELVALEVPETFQVGAPYEIRVRFEADGEVPIRKMCLRWVREEIAPRTPSVYCYVNQAQDKLGNEEGCLRWLAQGSHAQVSPLYCARPEAVRYGPEGIASVRLSTSNVRVFYDKLECYAEYTYGGKMRQSNRVSSPVSVENIQYDRGEP